MWLEWITLAGFRVHESLEFHPETGTNVLVGDNGAGKTSVLEAIGYLVTLRSFRGSPDAALVRETAESAVVRASFTAQNRRITIEIEIPARGRRTVLVNGKAVRSRGDVAESVTAVAFLPDDLDLVKREPAGRRAFVDDLAAQLWPAAASEQRDFDRALRQRNALLRREGRGADATTLQVWDERIARLGAAVMGRRRSALAALENPVSRTYSELVDGNHIVSWTYLSSALGSLEGSEPDGLEGSLLGALAEARDADLDRRTTTIGPHRDEIVIRIDERDARSRASQGEQRAITLALRLGSHDVLSNRRGESPILLLDDVFSELDTGRSERLVALLPKSQVFVTAARREDVPLGGRRWTVRPGEVVRE